MLAFILLWHSASRIRESRATNRRRLDGWGLSLFGGAMVLTVSALTRGRDGVDVAMGSGPNNTARYLGASTGITLFAVIATHVGADLIAGWNVAVLVSAALR